MKERRLYKQSIGQRGLKRRPSYFVITSFSIHAFKTLVRGGIKTVIIGY